MENKRPTTPNPLVNRRSMKGPNVVNAPAAAVKTQAATAKASAPINRTATANPAPKVAAAPIANKPSTNPVAVKPTATSEPRKEKRQKKNDKKAIILGVVIAVVVIAAIVGIIVAVSLSRDPSDPNSPDPSDTPNVAAVTEEEEKITKETLEKYAEVTIDGYKKEEGHEISSDIVKVHVKNISDDQTSLHIVIVANDKDGNALDVSHLYAEGIQPGDVQEFDAFVYTTMTPEQMKNATYKVYTAGTYEVNIPSEETTTEGAPAEEAAAEETPAE